MILIDDDFLSEGSLNNLQRKYNKSGYKLSTTWADADHIPIEFQEYIGRIQSIWGFKSLKGIEYWTHNNTRPQEWHYDKDEELYKQFGGLKHPMLATVLYLKTENVEGGNLLFKGASVEPKVNRFVCFSGDLKHYVEPYTGDRVALAVNFWEDTPIKYLP